MAYEELADFFFTSHPAAVQLQTIEITHPNFTTAFRFVRNDPRGILAYNEGLDGPYPYAYLPMEIKTLGTTNSLDQSMEITLGDLGQIIPAQLQILSDGNGFQTKPVLVYREYRSDEYVMEAVGVSDWTFDGVDDYISVGPAHSKERTEAFSVSAWISMNSATPNTYFLGKTAADSTARGWAFYNRTSLFPTGLSFHLANDNNSFANSIVATAAAAVILPSTLYHICMTYDGSSTAAGVNIYVDGVAQVVTPVNDNLTLTTLSLANLTLGENIDGEQTQTSLWDVELSAAEVLEIYNAGVPGNLLSHSQAANLELWFKIDSDDTDDINGVIDYSSSEINGTAQGGLGAATGTQVPVYQEPMFGPFTMQINSIAFNKSGCMFTAKPKAFNRARTGEIYDIGRFPMLVGFV